MLPKKKKRATQTNIEPPIDSSGGNREGPSFLKNKEEERALGKGSLSDYNFLSSASNFTFRSSHTSGE